jgi:exonuclease SbcC
MKILGIRFKNLNSLMGEWNIDFTHPDYSFNGIFAITGPTGSGKTTILDALCLGLYGRTPRLDKVTKSSNEIMSRQAGECFAEVTFETQRGRYRCHWYQHRARRKPDGELQPARHEISDAVSDKVLESKMNRVDEFIEKATGMDFERFTRSMLLAQGGFAAFLQATPDKRAPILEQITGTEVYSRISRQVHERFSAESKKLELLQAELKGIQVLSEEQISELNVTMTGRQAREIEIKQSLDFIRKALNWLGDIARFERELESLEIKRKDYEERRTAFDPEAKRLERSLKALGLEGDYEKVISLRNLQKTELTQLNEALSIEPDNDKARAEALELKASWETKLNDAKSKQASEAEVIKTVRALDARIGEQKKQLAEKDNAILKIGEKEAGLKTGMEGFQRDLDGSQSALKNVNIYLEKHADDAGLVSSLSAIALSFASLREIESKLSKSREASTTAESKKQVLSKGHKTLESGRDKIREDYENCRTKVQSIAEVISAVLKDRDIGEWREETDTLKDRERLLVQTGDSINRISRTGSGLSVLQKGMKTSKASQLSLSEEIKSVQQKKVLLENDIEHWETQVVLMNRIHDLEEDRQRLEEGKPCPLCGSTEHPYAVGKIPKLSAAEKALKEKKAEFKKASDNLGKLEAARAGNDTKIQQMEKEMGEKSAALESDSQIVATTMQALHIECASEERAARVEGEIARVRQVIAGNTGIIAEAEKKGKEEKKAQAELEKKRVALEIAEKALQDSNRKLDTLTLEHKRLVEDCTALEKDSETAFTTALKDLAPFGIVQIKSTELDGILDGLRARRDSWQTMQEEKSLQERNISALTAEIEKNRALLESLNKDMAAILKEREDLKGKYENLCSSRREMFGDRDPDVEEKTLTGAVQQATTEYEKARENLGSIEKQISALREKIRILKANIELRKTSLEKSEQELSARFKTAGFENEADYLSSRLGEDERNRLAERQNSLIREMTELDARRDDNLKSLACEREKNISDQPLEKLQKNLNTGEVELQQILTEIGGILKTLSDDKEMKQRQLERIRSIDAQKKELTRWQDLHALIGSADGKKFRNFAQGLTFEMMVRHANRQLKKMTDRYILIRDESQPLELNVIDNYQAGEIRSTKNLSGGESFIVSLALALGLSHMASQNVRVDSLFLDEGFGTLDEDALETALETLSGLQQDGKVIGVISHVAAFKERISTQIQVIPESGGKSRITGPGCCQI